MPRSLRSRTRLAGLFAATTLLGACASQSPTACISGDDTLREHVIGHWVVGKESADYMPMAAREEYRSDGGYTAVFFADTDCDKLVGQIDGTWSIDQGVLSLAVTQVSERKYGHAGETTKDRIVALNGDTMTLQPMRYLLALNTKYVRRRSEGCAAKSPVS